MRAAHRAGRLQVALTIAGSDSGSGAGVQADLKTFAALGVHAATAITALTAQNTGGVRAIHLFSPEFVRAQIDAVLDDFEVAAIKIGMLGSAAIVEAVSARLGASSPRGRREGRGQGAFVVYDPVMVASSGDALSGAGFVEAARERLLPRVDCLTPNLGEAAALLGAPLATNESGMAGQGRALLALGPRAVVMKGGHLPGEDAIDLLVTEDEILRFAAPKLASGNLHGSGCTLSSAIAAYVVLGRPLAEAVAAGKAFVRQAIERGRDLRLGGGTGPLVQIELS
jgi:hydroxymethylpyrimidine/phosphomethylpyrimidine kinase